MTSEFDADHANGQHGGPPDSIPGSPNVDTARPTTSGGASNGGSVYDKRVEDVMYSDIGINTLLNRLKQSIASARDFAQFLKKRSTLEEDQAKGLKRLTQTQLESVKRGDVRGGTYAQQLTEVLRVHERMADNGMQFALSLHQMHEDLDVLSANMERGRKQGKHDGLAAEKHASDLEAAMLKAKARYEGFAEDFDKARTGDAKAGGALKGMGIRGPKSAEQREQELQRKTHAAEADYRAKVDEARSAREDLIRNQRPKFVKDLDKYIKECDSALALQLQKFATFNEKLLLGNGLLVQPLSETSNTQRSLRDLVLDIDNERDFNTFVGAEHGRIPARTSDLTFQKSHVLEPKTQALRQPTLTPQTPAASQPALSVNTASSQPTSTNSRYGGAAVPPQSSFSGPSSSFAGPGQFSSSPAVSSSGLPPSDPFRAGSPPYSGGSSSSPYNPSAAPLRDTYSSTPPYPTHPSERAAPTYSGNTPIQSTGVIPSSPAVPYSSSPLQTSSPHLGNGGKGRVFGYSLDDLFARDHSAVPIIVFQCIQAVDMFGLEIEGIYRQTGHQAQVNRLRHSFDTLPPNDPALDFRNPSNFGHDVNAVTSLMKTFFRELPDPLFTKDTYASFIESAQVDGEDARRDALHQCINDLPDANYATMRALVLHLHRVMQNEGRTRMTAANLAVCLA